jgi:DNA polymerase-3 subunit gamma/tau
MTYQVLARKWRPQDFSSLIGQEPIVTALRNGLAEGRIAQAYLFSGIRGVGKTTAARVLAKALNCENGPRPGLPATDPCNDCPSCLAITGGNDIDFLEVDAATYSKVEQIRELTESLRYGPARGRYKVVVLDEVHRLSRQAFDALLKIVEEPPPHLVFIFATTEIDAVPATILSRCQEFQFRRVPSAVLAQYLRRISEAEEIEARDAALRLIARAGEGSVRDSVALLDQLATFGSGKISDQAARDLLGGLDAAVFLRLLEAILGGNGLEISAVTREVEAMGWDPYSVYGQFLVFARDGLQLAMGGRPDSVDLPLEEAQALAAVVEPAGYESLLRLSQLLLDSEESVRRSEFGMLAVQIAWLRAAELPKVVHIERLLSGADAAPPRMPPGPARGGGAGTGAPRVATARPAKSAAPRTARAAQPPASAAPDAAPAEPGPATSEPAKPCLGPPAAGPGPSRLPLFLERLSSKSPSLAALLNGSRDRLRFEDGELAVPEGDPQLTGALHRKHNREVFEGLIRDTWGEEAGWKWSAAAAGEMPEEEAAATDGDPFEEARQDPIVRAFLEIFRGSKIHSVRSRPQGEPRP